MANADSGSCAAPGSKRSNADDHADRQRDSGDHGEHGLRAHEADHRPIQAEHGEDDERRAHRNGESRKVEHRRGDQRIELEHQRSPQRHGDRDGVRDEHDDPLGAAGKTDEGLGYCWDSANVGSVCVLVRHRSPKSGVHSWPA